MMCIMFLSSVCDCDYSDVSLEASPPSLHAAFTMNQGELGRPLLTASSRTSFTHEGNCDYWPSLTLDGSIDWTPTIDLNVDVTEGTVRIGVNAQISATMEAQIPGAMTHC